jgi:hypothetical protein
MGTIQQLDSIGYRESSAIAFLSCKPIQEKKGTNVSAKTCCGQVSGDQ